jgi:hypothetical protein
MMTIVAYLIEFGEANFAIAEFMRLYLLLIEVVRQIHLKLILKF